MIESDVAACAAPPHAVPPPPDDPLTLALKRFFGFERFRPPQEAVMRDVLAGHDVFAVLPTGAGKSLCYQLPALVRPGLTVVVSPLIALMKDQVDGLREAGIAATYLNSSLPAEASRERRRGLERGEYRLLYLAPERLLTPGFLDDLARWHPTQLAVDEAHCISEWGHDFRPEYRRLAEVRARFPELPCLALTATATTRVRDDVVRLVPLRDPRIHIAGFDRPNLIYRVQPKTRAYAQTLAFVRGRSARESGIVYTQSRRSAESLAERLTADGVSAAAYHAGMSAEERARNQERFIRDDVRVICATIAFGMGIDKPNVRFVVHFDLPRSIEGYAQETGRAGRDGLPAECLLLFSRGDVPKQLRFIEERSDPREAARARRSLQLMVRYAESTRCRRRELLAHFDDPDDAAPLEADEAPTSGDLDVSCGACDNCLSPRERFDGTLVAQQFLSCLYRIRRASGFDVGLNHVVDVLLGADNEKVRRWGHDRLSTYGIGREQPRSAWITFGNELIRLGYAAQSAGQFSTLELTAKGRQMLTERSAVTLTRPASLDASSSARASGARRGAASVASSTPAFAGPGSGSSDDRASERDEELFAELRALRKRLADERDVPAYIVFSDVTLRELAARQPTEAAQLRGITGIGERKAAEYGPVFLEAIRDHLRRRTPQPDAPGRDVG